MVRRRRSAAFTLIELLTVIAILGILGAILVPATSAARIAALRAKTRAQFAQWGSAIESFRQEYGYYPTFETGGAGLNKVNGNTAAGTNLTAIHRFYETLTGVRRDGTALTGATTGNPVPPLGQNTRRISFITFTEADMVSTTTTDTTLTNKRGLLRDAFDNTDIVVLVDRNLDGKVALGTNGGDGINSLPAVSPADNTALRINGPTQGTSGDFPTGNNLGVRAGVIFYCAPPRAAAQADLLMSWK
ncbi:MAG: prepilin-type N-terminal cleavage/methylation domain-containing protein [Verrucomicrobia bacterium]|nr:prepilin-type N-terminal cleavage/methylation domain-containing protein [Verrucomicrobiota bacterium]